MAIDTLEQENKSFSFEPVSPLGNGGRQLGADAAAEQRELLALLLDEDMSLSGFARRGILMRVLALADISADLFEGHQEEPYLFASRLYGTSGEACSIAADRIRADRTP